MNVSVRLRVNDATVEVPAGANVAAALARAAQWSRRSRGGEPRAPLCGMGVCFECRVTIDGEPHALACMTSAREGMQVRTDD
ncbi:MAG TPA: 2Fe-2S iron-sulfur cluster-binding protein [Rhodanobacteraceae bacterium]|jgi:sarcosine oxidase subunit alpha|nr:2Fe-2S iron-sulfur cluster-binding protein [Rhodanobacteraceae bacterium]